MQHLEGSGTPVLYIGRTVLKGYTYTDYTYKTKLPRLANNHDSLAIWQITHGTQAMNTKTEQR